MIRRYNRREIFGPTTDSEIKYVSFLVDEAKTCADGEIVSQITEDMLHEGEPLAERQG